VTPTELITKASTACRSAQLLLDSGDLDGACNRAYYAMFDAARAALITSDLGIDAESVRSHGGLITAFSMHLVKPNRVPVALGKAFNRVEEIRLAADYRGGVVDRRQAEWAIEQTRLFVQFIQDEFSLTPETGAR
jgi:uncharacterized protein (UPF0332 family)